MPGAERSERTDGTPKQVDELPDVDESVAVRLHEVVQNRRAHVQLELATHGVQVLFGDPARARLAVSHCVDQAAPRVLAGRRGVDQRSNT
ncbi:hypothetical protein EYF80_054793 [Liparis tanakae]|uniref:Uncharacterized protein n=1 Tax=Liparis tanakae TaxID=230148 RepID=A0A4Z2F2Y1_9TELE|nr:hypothetical protein EYF80_054793 [Liparis tanakae]